MKVWVDMTASANVLVFRPLIALLRERGDEVTVLEKETRLSQHQTGRNSGVVHAGLYYVPGSLKATLCAAGRAHAR